MAISLVNEERIQIENKVSNIEQLKIDLIAPRENMDNQSNGQHATIQESQKSQRKTNRKKPDGIATNDLIFSAYVGNNSDLFPLVMSLYVPPGSIVADVTYGKGVFWRKIPKGTYQLYATDLKTGVDCRNLPYENNLNP